MKRYICLIILILLSAIVFAQEDYTIISKDASLCDCSSNADDITVKNTGTTISGYLIKVDNIFYNLPYNTFTLSPGQSKTITSKVNLPCKIRGIYNINIKVTTSNKLTKSITKKLEVNRCPNIKVRAITEQQVCPCSEAIFPIKVTNTRNFDEKYSFDIDKFKEYTKIDTKSVILKPKESKDVNLYLNLPCDFTEDYNLTFTTKTSLSKLTASTSLTLKTLPCYEYNTQAENYTLCEDDISPLELDIENIGLNSINIDFELEAPFWIELEDNILKINKGQTKSLKFIFEEPHPGDYNLILTSRLNNITQTIPLKLSIFSKEACYNPEITLEPAKQDSFKIKNKGIKPALYSLSINSDFISLEPNEIKLEVDEEKEINLNINWEGNEGKYTFIIIAESNDISYEKKIKVGEFVFFKKIKELFYNLIMKIKNFLINYLLYIITSIVILLMLVVVIRIFSKSKEKRLEKELLEEEETKKVEKKVKKKNEEVEEIEREIPWTLIIGVIIIGIVALIYFFFDKVKTFFLEFWPFFLSGIAALAIIIGIITLVKHKKNKAVKHIITTIIILLVLLFLYLYIPYDFSELLTSLKSISSPVIDFFSLYINYIITGVVILIIVVFFLRLSIDEKEKERLKEERKKKEKEDIKETKKKTKKIKVRIPKIPSSKKKRKKRK